MPPGLAAKMNAAVSTSRPLLSSLPMRRESWESSVSFLSFSTWLTHPLPPLGPHLLAS